MMINEMLKKLDNEGLIIFIKNGDKMTVIKSGEDDRYLVNGFGFNLDCGFPILIDILIRMADDVNIKFL